MKDAKLECKRSDAIAIWQAAVEAVRSDRLVRDQVCASANSLVIAGESVSLRPGGKIVVVGAGKAGAGMAAGFEQALGSELAARTGLCGWVNVPADCVRPLSRIHLHAARPAGVNEPSSEGEAGALEIMKLVSEAGENDLVIALISGGGSALLPLPIEGITLDDKLAVTRFLSAAGAPIDDLNTVRKQLSQIKGGGLARACHAGRLITLIISDVLGDPLDIIASGPTVEDSSRPADAMRILEQYGARRHGISERVFAALMRREHETQPPPRCQVSNHIIGNNGMAVAAAAEMAGQFGYEVTAESAERSEGAAEAVGGKLAEWALEAHGKCCLVSGGEPTVKLVESAARGRGGRNQQLVLAAVQRLWREMPPRRFVILSGGTDGEDGPTDAAGALADETLLNTARERDFDPQAFLDRNDAYNFFEPLGGLIKTGPTNTNVCDVRVVLVDSTE
jgi:hydroxypyruvate reductase